MMAEVEVNFRALRQPKLHALSLEELRRIVDIHMLAEKLNLWHRPHQVRFQMQKVRRIRGDQARHFRLTG